jgi:nucleotide-binding universal stress UspA family protein
MKNILITTDFTTAANDAARYGVELAKQFGAKACLFHAYEYPLEPSGGIVFSSDLNLAATSKEWLKAQADLINEDGTVKLERRLEEGPSVETILETAVKTDADIIVCGLEKKSRSFKKIFGNTTNSLIKKSDIPLLIIPEGYSYVKPRHMALAIDMDPETSPETLQVMKQLAEQFFFKISVVCVVGEGAEEGDKLRFHPPANIEEIKHLNPAFEFPAGSNIAKTVNEFATEHAIDILAVIPHKHNFTERLFTDSITRHLSFLTNLPLLVLPQKKITAATGLEKAGSEWKNGTSATN